MLPPAERLIGAQLDRYLRDDLYWVLHAPRQTGKTTFLQSWMREINKGTDSIACYMSVERCQGMGDIEVAMPTMAIGIRDQIDRQRLPIPSLSTDVPSAMLSNIMQNFAEIVAPKELIILFDEVDVLQGETLISFLRQLREGFATRGAGRFPTSIALVGMRDLKDYITEAKGGKAPNPGSPFNIKEDSAMIGNFSKTDVEHLFSQRTEETGQQITQEALDYVYDQSRGQPWIVNNLFKRATLRVLDEKDYSTVTLSHILEAREQMIQSRETHLDALAFRLDDPRVRYIIDTMMTGKFDADLTSSEQFRVCLDLGLVTIEHGVAEIANPIYREVLARQTSFGIETMLAPNMPKFKWEKPDGTLDMDGLLREFQKFWRRNSEIWERTTKFHEVFPHLLLMAFLHRITNGSGRIEREYAAGRGRMDLAIEYGGVWNIIEIKLIHDYDTPQRVTEDGLEQILEYRDKFTNDTPVYLMIFDRRDETQKLSWDERTTWYKEGDVTVIGC
jgi:hypothetical protein